MSLACRDHDMATVDDLRKMSHVFDMTTPRIQKGDTRSGVFTTGGETITLTSGVNGSGIVGKAMKSVLSRSKGLIRLRIMGRTCTELAPQRVVTCTPVRKCRGFLRDYVSRYFKRFQPSKCVGTYTAPNNANTLRRTVRGCSTSRSRILVAS